jgi:PD-(D/E)XK nuclease family transposase
MREATNPLATYADARRSNKALCTTSTTCSASERTHEPPVVAESITNPHLTPTNIDGKYIVLDILAKSANENWINIEMQMKKRKTWSSRSIYYLSKAMAGQLARGGKYDSIKPVIGIHLLAYDLHPDEDQALWCYGNAGSKPAMGQAR